MRIIITGGYGFIGSALIRHLLEEYQNISILNIDKLTSKFFPLFSVEIFCFFMGYKWISTAAHVFSSFSQDFTILFILTNQAIIISYQTLYEE